MRDAQFLTAPLAVKRHNPRGRALVVALLTLALVTAIAGAYFFGEYEGGYEHWIVAARHQRLIRQRDALAQSNADLHQQIVFLQRSAKVDHAARAKVQQNNRALQAQVVGLKKRLSFYDDIVAPGAVHSGVRIQALDLVAVAAPRRYHYSLILMQGPHHAREQHGTVEMKVIGKRDDRQVALSLADLQHGAADRNFKFRYFDNLKGNLTLPKGFDPKRIEVTLTQRGGNDDAVTREFDWRVTG